MKRFVYYMAFLFHQLLGGEIELIHPGVNRYGEWLDFYATPSGVY